MDDLTPLRAIRRSTPGPTDAALAKARTALNVRMAAPTRGASFSALLARLRRPSPLVVSFATIAAVAVVGIVVLSVFGTGIRAAVQPAVPVPTSTPTPTATVGSQRVFGGNCTALFSDAQVSSIMGSSLALEPALSVATSGEASLPVVMRGGVDCVYSAATAKDPTVLYFVVLPATPKVKDPYCYGSDKAPACSFGSVASGLWISGVAYGPKGTTTKSLITKIELVESDFAAKAATQKPVKVASVPGAWPLTTCSAIENAAHLSAALSSPGLEVANGNRPGESAEGAYSAASAVHELSCIWEDTANHVPAGDVGLLNVTFLPGGAFARDQYEAITGAKDVAIAGTDGAIAVTSDGFTTYTVFAGANLLEISGQATDAQLERAASTLVAALEK